MAGKKRYAVKFTISLSPELHDIILALMKKEVLSKSGVIAMLLKKALREGKNGKDIL